MSFSRVRVDLAGNISKKFSAAGIRFPRFSGRCTLWNVHAAFLQPGVVRAQCSRLPGGTAVLAAVLAAARTVRRHAGDYHAPPVLHSVGVGCALADAGRVVYADGMNLAGPATGVPIGITCRPCERARLALHARRAALSRWHQGGRVRCDRRPPDRAGRTAAGDDA